MGWTHLNFRIWYHPLLEPAPESVWENNLYYLASSPVDPFDALPVIFDHWWPLLAHVQNQLLMWERVTLIDMEEEDPDFFELEELLGVDYVGLGTGGPMPGLVALCFNRRSPGGDFRRSGRIFSPAPDSSVFHELISGQIQTNHVRIVAVVEALTQSLSVGAITLTPGKRIAETNTVQPIVSADVRPYVSFIPSRRSGRFV